MKTDRIRGSINVPLDMEGLKEADKVGKLFQRNGGFDLIICSSLLRARQTANIITFFNPLASWGPYETPALHPWHLGEFEGQPSARVMPKIEEMMERPNEQAPGRSPKSTENGESFNQFASRIIECFLGILDGQHETGDKVVVVTHLRCIKLLEAWCLAGMPQGIGFPVESMKQLNKEDPGSVFFLDEKASRLVPAQSVRKPGVYVVRHGSTALNGH